VDLGGASYSLDEDAFLALHAYLARAADRLGEHPDRDEVLAGLERSIGAKLARGGERSASIGAAEMTAALKEVGKVDGPRLGPERAGAQPDIERDSSGAHPGFDREGAGVGPGVEQGAGPRPDYDYDYDRSAHARPDLDPDSHVYADYSDGPRPRRLYRLSEGKMIAGVCAGLAAYLGIDVGLMRAITVMAAVFTGFFLIVGVYIALMFVVPVARTSTEIAAARGALRSA
jgi:phage shock protein PspC (stress-responsive transcriptional regulator)